MICNYLFYNLEKLEINYFRKRGMLITSVTLIIIFIIINIIVSTYVHTRTILGAIRLSDEFEWNSYWVYQVSFRLCWFSFSAASLNFSFHQNPVELRHNFFSSHTLFFVIISVKRIHFRREETDLADNLNFDFSNNNNVIPRTPVYFIFHF